MKRKLANESLSRLHNNQILNAKDAFLYCNENILRTKFLDQVPFFPIMGKFMNLFIYVDNQSVRSLGKKRT